MLARLTDLDVPDSRHAFADRLSQWIGWADAISLSAALEGGPAAPPARPGGAPASASAEERECARARAALVKAIADDGGGAADFPAQRRRYLATQQAMEAGIAPLRVRLRAALAARSPAMARLAAVDAVMERSLAAPERGLLATVPALLETHFERLRQAEQAGQTDAALATRGDTPDRPGGDATPGAWLNAFRDDMQAVLLAELDLRLQPVEGLLEALRKR